MLGNVCRYVFKTLELYVLVLDYRGMHCFYNKDVFCFFYFKALYTILGRRLARIFNNKKVSGFKSDAVVYFT